MEQYECGLLVWKAASLENKKFGKEYIEFPPLLKKRILVMEHTCHQPQLMGRMGLVDPLGSLASQPS